MEQRIDTMGNYTKSSFRMPGALPALPPVLLMIVFTVATPDILNQIQSWALGVTSNQFGESSPVTLIISAVLTALVSGTLAWISQLRSGVQPQSDNTVASRGLQAPQAEVKQSAFWFN